MGCNCSKLNGEDSRGLDNERGTNQRMKKRLRKKNRSKRDSKVNGQRGSELQLEFESKIRLSTDHGSELSQYMRDRDQMSKRPGLIEELSYKGSSYIQFPSIVHDENYSSMLLSSQQVCGVGLSHNSLRQFDQSLKSQLQNELNSPVSVGTKATENWRDHMSIDVNENCVMMGLKDDGMEQLCILTDEEQPAEAQENIKQLQIELDNIDPKHFVVEMSPSAASSCANGIDLPAPTNAQKNLVDLQDIDEDLIPLSDENKEAIDLGDEDLLIGSDDDWVGNDSGVADDDSDDILRCKSGNDITEDLDELIEEEEAWKPDANEKVTDFLMIDVAFNRPNHKTLTTDPLDRNNNTFDLADKYLTMHRKIHSETDGNGNRSLLQVAGHSCQLEQTALDKSLHAITERNMMSEVTSFNEDNGSAMHNSFGQWLKVAS